MLDPDTNGGYSYNKFKYTGTALTEDDRITYDARNLRNWREEEEDPFRAEPRLVEEEGDSGASTPPLWSPTRTRNHQGANQTRTMSPNSRTQAIARGQRELMDMVSQMPEGCYELSLKDIVEHRPVPAVEARQDMTSNSKVVPRRDQKGTKTKTKTKKKAAVVARSRSGSFDNGGGMFLKVLFPVSLGLTKKKGSLRSNSKGGVGGGGLDGRVSPRPLLFGEGEGSSSRYKDRDGGWWRKGVDDLKEDEEVGVGKESLGFSSSGKSGSSKSTESSSRSSSRNSTRHSSFTCWSCIFRNKGKRLEA